MSEIPVVVVWNAVAQAWRSWMIRSGFWKASYRLLLPLLGPGASPPARTQEH